MKRLDRRYRTKYGVSPFENLEGIRTEGMDAFLVRQADSFRCPKCHQPICIHRSRCLRCHPEVQ
jgi:hypothetical protein